MSVCVCMFLCTELSADYIFIRAMREINRCHNNQNDNVNLVFMICRYATEQMAKYKQTVEVDRLSAFSFNHSLFAQTHQKQLNKNK